MRYLLNRGNITKKGALKVWGWSFKKIPFALYTYVLTKILQNGAKFIQKLTPGFKSRMRNLDNFRQVMETPKSWNLVGCFCPKINLSKKYIPLAKILYTQDLTFNYLCENSKLLMSLYHISRHNSSVFFSSNTTYFLKRKPVKVQFFRLSAAWIKVYQIPHIIFQTISKFFFKVWIYFQCHEG